MSTGGREMQDPPLLALPLITSFEQGASAGRCISCFEAMPSSIFFPIYPFCCECFACTVLHTCILLLPVETCSKEIGGLARMPIPPSLGCTFRY